MLRSVSPGPTQREAIAEILRDDLARCPIGHPLISMHVLQASIDLLVLSSMASDIPQDIAHGIPPPSLRNAPSHHPGGLTGATSLGGLVASGLNRAISSDRRMTLLVPHAYALPSEVDSLQEDFGGNVIALGENVYVRFESGRSTAETIRRALASMISGFSVAWLFADAGALVEPRLALVPIFDADGFAVLARTTSDIESFFPGPLSIRA